MRRALQICAAVWAAYAVWRVQEALHRAAELEGWRDALEHDMDDLEDRTAEAFVAHAGRLDDLEARPSIEDALTQFAQRFLVERVRRAEGRPGPQG